MYAGHPSNELKIYFVWRTIYQHYMNQTLAGDQVRTVVMSSDNINENTCSFWDRYSILFSTDIASH